MKIENYKIIPFTRQLNVTISALETIPLPKLSKKTTFLSDFLHSVFKKSLPRRDFALFLKWADVIPDSSF